MMAHNLWVSTRSTFLLAESLHSSAGITTEGPDQLLLTVQSHVTHGGRVMTCIWHI
jgi:hypothetical protein